MFESPKERAKTVTLDLLSDRTLPNIILGAHLTAILQFIVGAVSIEFVAATGITWIISIVIYSYVDKFKQKVEEAKRKTLSEESDYYGIE